MPFTIGGDWIPSKDHTKQSAKVAVQKRVKKGRVLTIVLNVDLSSIQKVLQILKKKCHCGGSLSNGVIELQGEHLTQVQAVLKQENIL